MSRRVALLVLVALAFLAGTASAGKKKSRKTQGLTFQEKKKVKVRVCTEKQVKVGKRTRTKKSCRYEPQFSGHNAPKDSLRTEPLPRPSGEIWVRSENLQDELKVNIYAADGSIDEAVLAELDDRIFRCKRSHDVRAVDPRLYEQLSRIYDHFGQQRIELVSGYRGTERDSSRHHHASAMDIRIKGVSIRELYEFAESLDMGGMGIGIYPNSGFVHVDFRAPGDRSYRWVDRSYPGDDGAASSTRKRTTRARRPNS